MGQVSHSNICPSLASTLTGTEALFHGAAHRHIINAKEGPNLFHAKGPGQIRLRHSPVLARIFITE